MFIQSAGAECELYNRSRSYKKKQLLSGSDLRAKEQIITFSKKIGLLKAKWSNDYQNFLVSKGFFIK